MFFPYVISYNNQYRRNTIVPELVNPVVPELVNPVVPELVNPVVPELVNPVVPELVNPVKLVCSKSYNYGCEICKYIIISPNSKCKHNYCDYCLTTRIVYIGNKCIFC